MQIFKSRDITLPTKVHLVKAIGGPMVGNLPAKAGDPGSIPGSGISHMLQGN